MIKDVSIFSIVDSSSNTIKITRLNLEILDFECLIRFIVWSGIYSTNIPLKSYLVNFTSCISKHHPFMSSYILYVFCIHLNFCKIWIKVWTNFYNTFFMFIIMLTSTYIFIYFCINTLALMEYVCINVRIYR
jgi:hypothetical protein